MKDKEQISESKLTEGQAIIEDAPIEETSEGEKKISTLKEKKEKSEKDKRSKEERKKKNAEKLNLVKATAKEVAQDRQFRFYAILLGFAIVCLIVALAASMIASTGRRRMAKIVEGSWQCSYGDKIYYLDFEDGKVTMDIGAGSDNSIRVTAGTYDYVCGNDDTLYAKRYADLDDDSYYSFRVTFSDDNNTMTFATGFVNADATEVFTRTEAD